MKKINYVLIMLFMYIYSPVIYGQTKAEAIKTFKDFTGQDVTNKSIEEIKKIFADFTQKNIKQLEASDLENPTEESKKIKNQWLALRNAITILEKDKVPAPEQEDEEDDEDKLNEDYSGSLIKTGKSISKITLSGFVKSIGKAISLSLCKDRAFTIIPNIGEDGNRALGYILLTHER